MCTSKVYVLIRTSLNFIGYRLSNKRYDYFQECLCSVLRQTYSDIAILLLQDTKRVAKGTVLKTLTPKFCSKIVDNWRCVTSLDVTREVHFYQADCQGPALALYYLRKELLNLCPQENDIVIMLDDDDFFFSETAVQDIVDRMDVEGNSADVCLLSYKIVGDSSLDISNGAGYIHNTLIKQLESKHFELSEYAKDDSVDKWLSLADSLGWTKAYKLRTVKKYMNVLVEYFNFDENKLQNFYRSNNAYEDFPEILNLCWTNTKITGCSKPTHAYRKTKVSITAKPSIKDFSQKRPANLSLLLGLTKKAEINSYISDTGKITIARYVIIKLILIENILAKFRNDGVNHKLFRCFTERTYFFKHFIDRLTSDGFINYFAEILKAVKLYDGIGVYMNPDTVIKEAAYKEVDLGYVDVQQCIREQVIAGDKPINRYLKRMLTTLITCAVIILCVLTCTIILISQNSDDLGRLVTIAGSIISAILAYAGKSVGDYFSKIDQDEGAKRIYRNELNDMVRHLYANLNVLLQIKRELDNNIPAQIHFINLKIPQNSILLSEEPIKDIMINELDTIARIKVNIRNINNSADYLSSLVSGSESYNECILKDAISWEITRYVGYIFNLLYVIDDPSFRFPQSKEQLDRYINVKGVFQFAAKEINGGYPDKVKGCYDEKEIDEIIQMLSTEYFKYKDDRERQRNVLFINNQNYEYWTR